MAKKIKKVINLSINNRVKHPKWGLGTVTEIWRSGASTNNYAIKFDKGGPVGFADRANNTIRDLEAV
jgi:hypothetical protein